MSVTPAKGRRLWQAAGDLLAGQASSSAQSQRDEKLYKVFILQG